MIPVQADIRAILQLARETGMGMRSFFAASGVYYAAKWCGMTEEEAQAINRAYLYQPVEFRREIESIFGVPS